LFSSDEMRLAPVNHQKTPWRTAPKHGENGFKTGVRSSPGDKVRFY
jgi:hypothetical protein